jgi:2-amino-4-hydroxy-6-hydroxymethyldihydropteridine diphosphokinase
MPDEWAFVALGSNLGDREAYLRQARQALAALSDTTLVASSRIEETAPLGPPGQGPYLNQMVLLRTGLTPLDLLAACQAIERDAGRVRGARWAPRTLDLDIVRYGGQRVNQPELVLPHPELTRREFRQRELEELEPHAR